MKNNTTFKKLTMGFVFLGMLPLIITGLTIFMRFSGDIRTISISNYSQITSYFSKNVGDLIESVDKVMEELYDYESSMGTLTEVINNKELEESQCKRYMMKLMQEIISKSNYISSVRFVDDEGREYSLFYDQNKTMKKNPSVYTKFLDHVSEEDRFSLMISATTAESEYCVNTDDYIFTLIRNFYDISSVEKITKSPLGTIYMDINEEEIEAMVAGMNLESGSFYVYHKDANQYLYSPEKNDYQEYTDSLSVYREYITGDSGEFKFIDKWVFYEQIQDTDLYAVLIMDASAVVGDLMDDGLAVAMIICFALFMLLILYMFFSVRISQPISELKKAMEEVQKGNLNVQAQVKTKDEMQYISEGFNKMVKDLQDYIDQVYVAQLCQKEAELNALKMQIKPHYLYNTLDVIRMTALEHEDTETAALLESLASQLRYVLGRQNEKLSLQNEIHALQEYVNIARARYKNRMHFHVVLAKKDANLLIPKMLLQPVIENAVKHGLKNKEGEGTLVMEIERHSDYLEIRIMDDGIGMTQEQIEAIEKALEADKLQHNTKAHISIGMKNVHDRIKLICGKEYGFTIQSVEGMGTIVTFRLPIWEEEMSDA